MTDRHGPIVIVGEVLADEFEDGTSVIGGAPMNVAWNLTGMGYRSYFETGVGHDALGEEIVSAAESWGMPTDGFQRIADRPTGRVRVSLRDGQPDYDILRDQAYDRISLRTAAAELLDDPESVLVHGSLCFRGPTTRATIEALRKRTAGRVFCDINVRAGQFEPDWLPTLLEGTDVLKCNEDELVLIAAESGCPIEVRASTDWIAATRAVMDRWGIDRVWLTRGADGATAVDANGEVAAVATPSIAPEQFADAVGAGDALASVVIGGMIDGAGMRETLERAVQFAAKVCTLRGATTTDKSFY